jgi:sigma-B regulation protein RsbU (phosphoserine phosphatase)
MDQDLKDKLSRSAGVSPPRRTGAGRRNPEASGSQPAGIVEENAAPGAPPEGSETHRAWVENLADAIAFLTEVADELNTTLDLDSVLQRVAMQVKQVVDYDTFGVLLLDPLGQELRFRFGLGYPPEVLDHWRFGLGQGIVGVAARTGQPVRVDDVRTDPRYIDAGEEIRSELAIPLTVKNRTIGVLDVGSREPRYFTESHQALLSLLAGRLANSIENARLYENLQEQTRTLSLLYEVSRELTSILEREELLRRVAQLTKRLVNYQGFHVLLWNAATQKLESTFSLRYDERIVNKGGLSLGEGICGNVAALRQTLRVPNVHVDPRYVRCGDAVEVRSELAVPLVFKDRLVGVIDLESTEYNSFTEQHEQILSTLATYIAIALENARLYEKVREDEQRLESDLNTAREIQKGLLPEAAPRLAGLEIGFAYEPARQLGGDVFDFLSYPDGRLAVAVGDVAGKGAAAALYGSLAIGILRGHVVEHPCEPAEMLELLNHHLRLSRVDNRYIAFSFGIFDAGRKTLAVANSGFPRPLLVRRGKAEPIAVDGVPLGLLPDTKYEEKAVALQPGDYVVFCSDGIQECVVRKGEEFGAGRLAALLQELSGGSASQMAQRILRATDSYIRGSLPPDDRTVVVVRITGE